MRFCSCINLTFILLSCTVMYCHLVMYTLPIEFNQQKTAFRLPNGVVSEWAFSGNNATPLHLPKSTHSISTIKKCSLLPESIFVFLLKYVFLRKKERFGFYFFKFHYD